MHAGSVPWKNPPGERQLLGNYLYTHISKMVLNNPNGIIGQCPQQQNSFYDEVVHQKVQDLDKRYGHRMVMGLLLGQSYHPPRCSRLEQHQAPCILDPPFPKNDDPIFTINIVLFSLLMFL